MKIIGFTYLNDHAEMVLRSDSCLLNGGKPFFLPDGQGGMGATRCIVLRVSRLGKNIAAKFASRYYDAWAPGLDIIAWDSLREAQSKQTSWTEAIAFDYSLPLGEWMAATDEPIAGSEELCISPAEAIEKISQLMTIRQGDLIYIDCAQAPAPLHAEDVITGPAGYEDKLYCKIK